MSDWEEEFEVEVAIPKKQKWDDEDAEDDVKDDWEDSDSDEEKKPAVVAPVHKRVPLAQKIAEKTAAEEKRKKELEAKKAAMAKAAEEETEEDAFERKQRMHRLELEADLNNATDLFSGVAVSKNSETPIEQIKPKTRVEFEAYQKRLAEMITAHSKSMNYATFVEKLVRELAAPLKDMDVRKAASTLTALANDKQRQAKEALKTKKKGKPQLAGAGKTATRDDVDSYVDTYDDFDDFM
ncbi:Translation initiation factor 3 subunit J component [Apophysomyces sp. BC1034]|nr:Translation initiation factor 3 subunit J component [Apophysomyces sp. BC1015]KAG0183207.1 Translation initiation factor 3 subunit J component [Apophysomyces sp. BC1021]KAG0194380.1 Translation initiation factor 3 subunit J component [Apophysomyces sp. BC1034]